MKTNKNPQAEQMADESMVRCLAAQASAVWPQEQPMIEVLALEGEPRILDVACGTGEFSARVAELLPHARLTGIDLVESHLQLAREATASLVDRAGAPRARFESGDAFDLAFDDGHFDLVACRHFLQAIPHPEKVIDELVRVTRPGGHLHIVAEDYGLMHFTPGSESSDRFWLDGPYTFGKAAGFDLHIGRKMPALLRAAGLEDVRLDYVNVDTERVPRATFAAIWTAWRDGYSKAIAEHSRYTEAEARGEFDAMIAAIEDPSGFGLWQLPVVQARRPA